VETGKILYNTVIQLTDDVITGSHCNVQSYIVHTVCNNAMKWNMGIYWVLKIKFWPKCTKKLKR